MRPENIFWGIIAGSSIGGIWTWKTAGSRSFGNSFDGITRPNWNTLVNVAYWPKLWRASVIGHHHRELLFILSEHRGTHHLHRLRRQFRAWVLGWIPFYHPSIYNFYFAPFCKIEFLNSRRGCPFNLWSPWFGIHKKLLRSSHKKLSRSLFTVHKMLLWSFPIVHKMSGDIFLVAFAIVAVHKKSFPASHKKLSFSNGEVTVNIIFTSLRNKIAASDIPASSFSRSTSSLQTHFVWLIAWVCTSTSASSSIGC
jgi:hypothetical protein